MIVEKYYGTENTKKKGDGRDVSLLFADVREWMKKAEPKGLCFLRFKENILIKKNDQEERYIPQSGDRIQIGDSILRVTDAKKRCFEECKRYNRECSLRDGCFFAVYEQRGEIREGMVVCLKQ